ncbi:hypothetical protein [Streptomyces litchfieldiae]|uniref:Secreted protein n=1 Tax=Streptomyces litchfieldiae TaxID=3075543 RepID=A0ABU2MSY6_9ACTN|nr:hypothetical protein [Streptomyces sp. DSM 44938]MDT0343988.1 hypothetical protein [Streptomyces sp. DSM 44938]
MNTGQAVTRTAVATAMVVAPRTASCATRAYRAHSGTPTSRTWLHSARIMPVIAPHTGRSIARLCCRMRSTDQLPRPKTRMSLPSAGEIAESCHIWALAPSRVPARHVRT